MCSFGGRSKSAEVSAHRKFQLARKVEGHFLKCLIVAASLMLSLSLAPRVSAQISLPAVGNINTVAGSGIDGYTGDGGSATSAKLAAPGAVAVDVSGNLYIADISNNRVRKVTASTGVISTVAGNGTAGYSGDGGQATAAKLYSPIGVAVDASGNLYIVDNWNNRIRKVVLSTGVITTIAGNGGGGYAGDGGQATSAQLLYPDGVAVDSSGNLYIADSANNRIRKVTVSTGVITTVAGNGTVGYSGDGSPATSAELNWPWTVAVDIAGNILIADEGNNVIRRVTASGGIITTVAGNGTAGFSGDGGAAASATLHSPEGVAVAATGDILIADANNNRIRLVSASNGLIFTIAGNGTAGFSGDNGTATVAEMYLPRGLSVDTSGHVYFADMENSRIRAVGVKITPTISLSGSGSPSTFGNSVTLTATISIGPTGSVTFYDGSTSIGTATISGTSAILTTSALVAGTHSLTASWPGNTNYNSVTSGALAQTVNKGTPVITWATPAAITYGASLSSTQLNAGTGVAGTLSYSPSTGTVLGAGSLTLSVSFSPTDSSDYLPASGSVSLVVNKASPTLGAATSGATSYGSIVTFTATISSGPSGTITFYDAGTAIGTGALSGTTATLTTSALAPGSHSITAGWAGNSNYNAITSTSITQTVNKATPTLSISTSGTPTTFSATVTFTAALSSGPTGTVTFYDSGTALGTATISGSTAVYSTGALTAATHTISAQWPGNANFNSVSSGTITQVINRAATPTISWSTPAPITYGTALSSTQLDASTTIGGSFAYTPASGTVLGAGSQTLSAIFTPSDSTDYNPTSASVTLTVNKATPSLSLTTSSTPSTYGAVTILTASVYGGATGTVTFYDAGTAIGSSAISNGVAALSLTSLAAGSHNITVQFAGNSNFNSATSNSITQVVNQAAPTLTLSTSGTPSIYGTSITLTATFSSGPTGVVTFYDSSTTIGTATISGNSASLSTSTLSAGTHSLTAGWPANSNYSSVTSTAVAQVVNLATPSISLTTSGASSTYGVAVTFTSTISSGPSGTITFYDGGSAIGTGAISGTTAIYSTSALTAGNHSITAGWSSSANYNAATSGAVTQTVAKTTPVITWSPPGIIPNGTALGASQLGALANAAGSFTYSPGSGTVMPVGTQTLSSTFTPNDTSDYNSASANRSVLVTLAPGANIITTIAGNGTQGYTGDGALAMNAELNWPSTVALDASGNVYFTDPVDNVVRKISAVNGTVSTMAGNATMGYSGDGQSALNAEFSGPTSVAVDTAGNLYVADAGNHVIRKVTASSGIISTVAGNGIQESTAYGAFTGDGGPATSGEMNSPRSVAVDSSGNIYIADPNAFRVRKVTAATSIISTVFTSSSYNPVGVAVDTAGNIYIADMLGCQILKLTPSGAESVVAGTGESGTSGDGGPATSAELYMPTGVAVDSSGNVYVIDPFTSLIREVRSATGIISTVAGNAIGGFSGDGGSPTTAQLGEPSGAAIDSAGNLFIADSSNNRVRAVGQVNAPKPPSLTWAAPAPITYGTALSSVQLDASGSVPGTFAYTPAAGTVLSTGTYSLSVTFTPTDTVDYSTITTSVPLTANKATPSIIWPAPSNISQGTALSSVQLDATSPVPGTFVYSPAAGTVLPRGLNTLLAVLLPSDSADYIATSAQAFITVNSAANTWDTGTVTLNINNSPIATANYGQGSTPTSIAAALASSTVSSAPVTVTAIDDAIYIEAKSGGSNYSYWIQGASSIPPSQASFMAYPGVSGSLSGGETATSNGGGPIYNYQIPPYVISTPPTGYDAVGNVVGYSDSTMGNWTFGYDALNRITSAGAGANVPTVYSGNTGCWSYDAFGNRTAEAMSTTACLNNPPLTSWANYNVHNQFTNTSQAIGGASYDAVGDVTYDGQNQYLYDAEGRICAVSNILPDGMTTMTGYIYDADGRRVAKGTITSWSCDPSLSGFRAINDYIIGPSGEQITEMGTGTNNTMTWQHTNVWAAGSLIATYDDNGLHFYLNDWLGTRRAQTDFAGVIEQTCTGLPFGNGLNCSNSTQYPTEHHFTGKERDQESGNDYFSARYYASSMGRFMSPDPLPWIGWQSGDEDDQKKFEAYIANPQNFNMYAYVNNNPLNKTDPTGMNACGTNNDSSCKVTVTIQDRSKDSNGHYNDQYTGVKNSGNYNATATVSVNGKETGTFLVKTTPSDSSKSATIANGTYSGTLTTHSGDVAIRLQPTNAIPTIGPNPSRQDGASIAQGILVHRAGIGNFTGVGHDGRAVSEGCQVVCTSQYGDFKRATGMIPSAGSPQQHFTVIVNTQENEPQ